MSEISTRLLFQVDLEGHSAWLRGNDHLEKVDAKAKLADSLTAVLLQAEFARVCWAGDGGLYSRSTDGMKTYDAAIRAADRVHAAFVSWAKTAPEGEKLRLRISIHAATILVHDDPGYWTGDHLNVFMKYERAIAIAGTIAITDDVRRLLSRKYAQRFSDGTRRTLMLARDQAGQAIIRYVYHASLGADIGPMKAGAASLIASLQETVGGIEPAAGPPIGPIGRVPIEFGETAVLFGSPARDVGLSVTLEEAQRTTPFAPLSRLADDWKRTEREIASQFESDTSRDRDKVSVDRVTLPLTDSPLVVLRWHSEKWSRVRSLHRVLSGARERDSGDQKDLCARAAELVDADAPLPGLLCVHMVVRVRPTRESRPTIVATQRQQHAQPNFYHAGRWSFSIEEQLLPGESVEECVARGVSEELLGMQAGKLVSGRVVAGFLERGLLNFTLAALVDLPLTLSELHELWRTGHAPDRDEARQVVGFDDPREILREGRGVEIPASARDKAIVLDQAAWRATTEWRLHPTSALRLAIAAWSQ